MVFKVIIYGEGWYLAIPNYGLVDQSTIPNEELIKHTVISNLPIVGYVVASIMFAYFVRSL